MILISRMQTFFITSTINKWIKLLIRNDFKNIIIQSLKYLIENKRIKLNAYVIMSNHIHLIISVKDRQELSNFLRDFHKYTAQQFIFILVKEKNQILNYLICNRKDRKIRIWQSTHAVKSIVSSRFMLQKLNYIHSNPCQDHWMLCNKPEDYAFSSAKDYLLGESGLIRIEKLD